MAGNEKYYDTSKMRNAASDIRAQVQKYKTAKDNVDSTVKELKAYWDDSVNQNYVSRYNNDLEPTAAGIQKLMEAFATFLDDSAKEIDEWVAKGNTAIN